MNKLIKAAKNQTRKWFCIPSPKELGQKSNALGSKLFGFQGGGTYTWEDYEKEVRIRFPFRYFFFRTIPQKINVVLRPIRYNVREALYWLKTHLIPKHRYHFLDLRQPKGGGFNYRWGYINPDDKMMLAVFNILCEFIEKEGPTNPLDNSTLAELSAQGQMTYYNGYLEMMELYNWWRTGRRQEHDKVEEFFSTYREEKNHVIYNQKSNQWIQMNQELDKKDDEMLERLMKIRRQLWS